MPYYILFIEVAKAVGGVDYTKYDKIIVNNLLSSSLKLDKQSNTTICTTTNTSSSNNGSGNNYCSSSSSSSFSSKNRLKDHHNDICGVCEKGGDLMCCDTCTIVFHLKCIRPKMKAVPKGVWSCAYCVLDVSYFFYDL